MEVCRGREDVSGMERARRGELDLRALENEIATLAAHIDAASWRVLDLIREFDARNGWQGAQSCAHWLNWRIGLGMVAAREHVRVAKALPELPKTSDAFRRGLLSYSKVRALTRIATPATEEHLLGIARAGTASHVEKLARSYRRACPEKERSIAQRRSESRFFGWHTDSNGMLVVEGRLPPEVGAALVKAMEGAMEGLRRHGPEKRPGGEGDDSAESSCQRAVTAGDMASSAPVIPLGQRRADALALLLESGFGANLAPVPGAERTLVTIHVDREVLADPAADGRSELEDGPSLAPDTVRRLACDASVVTVTHAPDGGVLDVGRRTRSLPARMRRALAARDGRCRFPGCDRTSRLQGHHVKHWADGGATRLSNLVELCWFHHRAVHEGGWTVEAGSARGSSGAATFIFRDPQGRELPDSPAVPQLLPDPVASLMEEHRAAGITPQPRDTIGSWSGEPMDYGWAVDTLFRMDGII